MFAAPNHSASLTNSTGLPTTFWGVAMPRSMWRAEGSRSVALLAVALAGACLAGATAQPARPSLSPGAQLYPSVSVSKDVPLVMRDGTRLFPDVRLARSGGSYLAIDRLPTAPHRPRGLKATFAIVPAEDLYRDWIGHGGGSNPMFPLWLGITSAGTLAAPARHAAADPAT